MKNDLIQQSQFLHSLFDSIPSMLFIVDDDVKVLHLNASARKLHGDASPYLFLDTGGQVLNCIHSTETPHGCGSTPSCRGCTVRRAVRTAAAGRTVFRETTRMEVRTNGASHDMHCLVTASPFVYENESLVLLIMEDISELKRAEDKLRQANELLERQAATDPLTGIYNRLRFNEFLAKGIEEAHRYGHPLSIIMFDIDHFKKINDRYGHQAGDRVLKEVAAVVSSAIRKADCYARWGGEEFMVLSSHADREQAAALAEKLRQAIEECRFDGSCGITCSFGVTGLLEGDTIEGLTGRADHALYQAKNSGRNRVVVL